MNGARRRLVLAWGVVVATAMALPEATAAALTPVREPGKNIMNATDPGVHCIGRFQLRAPPALVPSGRSQQFCLLAYGMDFGTSQGMAWAGVILNAADVSPAWKLNRIDESDLFAETH
jgi:hypothetical protein